jgi:hypothetical protein
MNTGAKLILGLFILTLAVSACRKDKDEPPVIVPDVTKNIILDVDHMAGTMPFALQTDYVGDSGTAYRFTRAEMYLSNIDFKDMMGMTVKSTGAYILVKPSGTTYNLGTIEGEHYHTINFAVGVDSATNHSDPTVWPEGHDLLPQNPSTHWGWSTGYKFIILEGLYDSTGDGTPNATFGFHVGKDGLYREGIQLMVHEDVIEGEDLYIDLNIDWTKLFTGINLSVDNQTHSGISYPLAERVADNAPTVFSHD